MGGAVKKATKRYNKQHGAKKPGGVTKGAKGGKPVQRSSSKPRTGFHKKGGNGSSKTGGKGSEEDEAPSAKPSVKDMDVDAFLDGGFKDIAAPEQSSEEEDQSSADEGPDEEVGEDMSEGESDDEEGAQGAEADGTEAGSTVEEEEEEGSEEDDGGKGNDPVAADNKRLKGEVARHKAQLEALREKDPEFYAYLQQTDANLLGFGEDVEDEEGEEDDEEGSEDEEESEDEDAAPKKKAKEAKPTKEEADQDDGAEEEGKPSAPLTVTSQLVCLDTLCSPMRRS
ncbi:hypothetical protein DUNSADRAFT_5570 [Dunaliella salina]|uniref:Uncharacterized protein n=1 Tax=Dunaliella salina TaxID=3046 RepID=A0ABQ7GQ11_DUNSA|nr:hypothetical protein DUNSADRAFT_5570 [Dunaliella salina]|eukprot:KAF5836696.1 hypothetical protein DUNSADRAFT_5570 [Dunaliella salina]